MLKHLLPLLLVSSNAFAADCFTASDTSTLKVQTYTDERDLLSLQDVKAARLELSVLPASQESREMKLAELTVETSKGLVARSNSFEDMGVGRYVVECDGGSMQLKNEADGSVSISSEGIRADIEGCDGIVDIISSNTKFVPVQCSAAPSTN